MKYIITTIATSILCVTYVFATAQESDYLLYEGEKHALYTNPLDSYFEQYPEKKPESEVMSTGLWRGYVATFCITNGLLQLNDIEIMTSTKDENGKSELGRQSVINHVVPKDEVLVIDWFTGILTLPQGEVENYVHMGYGSTYSKYTLLEIKNGKLGKVRQMDSEEYEIFRAHQYAAFKKTEKYREVIKEMEDYDPHKHDDFIRGYFAGTYSSIILDDEHLDEKPRHDKVYYFQHTVLPAILFASDGAFFTDLKNGDYKIINFAKDVIDDDFSKAMDIQPVRNMDAYTITFQEPKEHPECYYALIIKDGDDYLYYTLERGVDLSGAGAPRVLCQWEQDERHIKHGVRDCEDLESFVQAVAYIQQYNQEKANVASEIVKDKPEPLKELSKKELRAIGEQYIQAWESGNIERVKAFFLQPENITQGRFNEYAEMINKFNIDKVGDGYIILEARRKKGKIWLHYTDHTIPDWDERWLLLTPDGKIKYDSILLKHPIHIALESVLFMRLYDNEEEEKRIYSSLEQLGIPLFGLDLSDSPIKSLQSLSKIFKWLLKEGDKWDSSEPKVFYPKKLLRDYEKYDY